MQGFENAQVRLAERRTPYLFYAVVVGDGYIIYCVLFCGHCGRGELARPIALGQPVSSAGLLASEFYFINICSESSYAGNLKNIDHFVQIRIAKSSFDEKANFDILK